MASKRLRRAGARWRLLAHTEPGTDGMSGAAHSVYSHQPDADRHNRCRAALGDYPTKDEETVTVLPSTEFDEIAVGAWLHAEQMASGHWHINVGGVAIDVRADRDGRPRHVMVYGPDDYAGAVEGCEYQLAWTGEGAP